jgi:hypothetical protein
MLKLTYSEFGLHLEQIDGSMEQWIAQRSILAVRIGSSICFQPGNASFLVPAAAMIANVTLDQMINPHSPVSFCSVDEEFYEVNITGVWIFKNSSSTEATFATGLDHQAESLVRQLWKISQQEVPTYSELRGQG